MTSQKILYAALMGMGLSFMPLIAQDGQVKPSSVCDDTILMSYFPAQFVEKTLEKYKVPAAQRGTIIRELGERDKEVIPLVEEKASKMAKNPLKDPSLRQEAIKIFRDTLYELFSKTMQKYGVTNKEELLTMLDDIQRQKAEYFARCMEQSQKEGMRYREEQPVERPEIDVDIDEEEQEPSFED